MKQTTLKEPYVLVFEQNDYDDVYRITYEFYKTEKAMTDQIQFNGDIEVDLIHFCGKLSEATFFNEDEEATL